MSGQTHTHGYMGMGFPWVQNQRPLPIPTIYPQTVPRGFLYPCQSLQAIEPNLNEGSGLQAG